MDLKSVMEADVAVIGGGATGIFTALDLTLRGLSVILIEKGSLLSGTSGKFHGLLHSGARYAVDDKQAAKECREESKTLARMAPFAIVSRGGFFVHLKGEQDRYIDTFVNALAQCGISFEKIEVASLLKVEPQLTKEVDFAVKVDDMVLDPFRFFYSAATYAKRKGAKFLLRNRVSELNPSRKVIKTDKGDVKAKIVVNATGPWAAKLLRASGKEIELMPALGIMLVYERKLVHSVINRLRAPSDGDIIVPFYERSILGTTAQLVEDVDKIEISEDDIKLLQEQGAQLIPSISDLQYSRLYFSARPLVRGGDPRETTRDFQVIDDDWIISVIGGKLTTSRLMAESVSDLVCEKLGLKAESQTKSLRLSSAFESTPVKGSIAEEVYEPGMSLALAEEKISS
ncbi:MAG: FAD-dependent oxidoreductase [Conexivisphaerales archaeon]